MQPPLPDPPSPYPLPQRSIKAYKWPFKNPAVPEQLSLGACKEATGANQSLPAAHCSCCSWLEGLKGRAFLLGCSPLQSLCKLEAGAAIAPWTYVPPFTMPSIAVNDFSGHPISMSCCLALEALGPGRAAWFPSMGRGAVLRNSSQRAKEGPEQK